MCVCKNYSFLKGLKTDSDGINARNARKKQEKKKREEERLNVDGETSIKQRQRNSDKCQVVGLRKTQRVTVTFFRSRSRDK